jgi:hypothetical protein
MLVLVVWLICETVAAMAVRFAVLEGRGILGSFAGAFSQLAHRPLSSLLTATVTTGISVLALGLALVFTATAFDWSRIAARSTYPFSLFGSNLDLRAMVFALAALALALAWVVSLVVAGETSAWRSAAFTAEAQDAQAGSARPAAAAGHPQVVGLAGDGPNPGAG